MIIEAKNLPQPLINFAAKVLGFVLKKKFNKLIIHDIDIKPNCSYLLMCSHFSFWDGFWACYLVYNAIHKKVPAKAFYTMVLKKQLKKNMWMRYFGCFSISPLGTTAEESLNYAANILNTPGNILLVFPQGNLESNYVRHIELKEGIEKIISKTNGECQLIWSTNLIEYFESLKPSVYFHMLDCGSTKEFNFSKVSEQINRHHKEAIKKHFRFTSEPA